MTLRDGNEIQQIIYGGGHAVTVQVIDESTRRGKRWGDPLWLNVSLAQMPAEWLQSVRNAADEALRIAA